MVTARQAGSGAVALRAAVETETVRGDLQGAIEQYKRVVETHGRTDRASAAQALLRMAEAYQRLGDAQAKTIYERVVRDYGDQTEFVAAARARLASAPVHTAPAVVWPRAKVDAFGNGRVSPDGRQIAYVDWTTGDLALHDLNTGADRRLTASGDLTTSPGSYAGLAAFAPDRDRVAFAWFNRPKSRYDIRIVSTSGSGVPKATVIYDNEEALWVHPYDWSPDGRRLALQIQRTDRTGQIALLDVHEGQLRVLQSFPWQAPSDGMRFSPDGRYLAFDRRSSSQGGQRDVHVLAVDGSREIPAIVHPGDDEMVGWTSTGSQLLFLSDRSGPWSLWALDMNDGKPSGAPRLLRAAVGERGRFSSLGITSGGSLFYVTGRAIASGIRIAEMDFAAPRLVSAPRDAGLELASINDAFTFAWIGNGRSLAVFRPLRPGLDESGFMLTFKDMTTGAVREVRPQSGMCGASLQLAADGSFFICEGMTPQQRFGILRVDAATGQTSFIVPGHAPSLSADGRLLYFLQPDEAQPFGPGVAIVERQLTSGAERELMRRGSLKGLRLSPDGQLLATVTEAGPDGTSALALVSTSEGQPRELLRLPRGEGFAGNTLFWSPDGGAVFVQKSVTGAKPTLIRVTLEGSVTAHPDVPLGRDPLVHPDGRQIAYAVPVESVHEVHRLDRLGSAPASRGVR
jgi:Tol biopolymer transport system component